MTVAGNAPDLGEAIEDMNRAVRALALELPQEVWRDVADRYERLRWAYSHVIGQKEMRINQLELGA